MFSRVFSATFVIVLVFASSLATSHAAKIYHWVDDKGQPHFSEKPPRERTSKELNVRASGKGSASNVVDPSSSKKAKTSSAISTEKTRVETKSLVSEHSAEDKAKYCQQSHKLLQQMKANTQRRFKQPDGSYRKLEQAEVEEYRAQAQTGIENYCQ